MGCLFVVTTIDDAFQIVGWMMTTVLIFILATFTSWNPRWFAYLRGHVFLPTEKAVFSGLTVLAVANGWAAWRLWVCENWDVDPVPLLLYLLMIIGTGFFYPVLMWAPTSVYLPILVAIIAFALSIAYTVFAFFDDMWAGLVGVADILVTLMYIIVGVQIWMDGTIYKKYRDVKDTEMVDKDQREKMGGRGYSEYRTQEMSSSSSSAMPVSAPPVEASAAPGPPEQEITGGLIQFKMMY